MLSVVVVVAVVVVACWLFFVVAVVVLATGGTPQTLFGLMDNHLLPLAEERNVSDIFGEHLYCSPLP